MEKLLIIFGIYLYVFPKMFKKTYFADEVKFRRITQSVGVCTLIVGILHLVWKMESGSIPNISLMCILFIWNIMVLLYKWKKDNCRLSKIMCGICIILFIFAIIIALIDITEIISSILMLIGSLIILYVPYSKIKVEIE